MILSRLVCGVMIVSRLQAPQGVQYDDSVTPGVQCDDSVTLTTAAHLQALLHLLLLRPTRPLYPPTLPILDPLRTALRLGGHPVAATWRLLRDAIGRLPATWRLLRNAIGWRYAPLGRPLWRPPFQATLTPGVYALVRIGKTGNPGSLRCR
eukprot:1196101-Prorocentrum_minimum.AAC.1